MYCSCKASLKSLKESESEIRSPSLPSLSCLPFYSTSLPSLKLTSEQPSLAYRQTSDLTLNCRIIHHCHRVTSTALGSFGAHHLLPFFFGIVMNVQALHRKELQMENMTNEQNDLRHHLSDIWPLPCLQPTLGIIYREPHRRKTLIQVVITVHDTVCAVNHMLRPARVPRTQTWDSNCCWENLVVSERHACQSGSRQWNEDKVIERVCGTDFKTLLSPALRDTYQKKYFQVSLYLF